MIMSHVISLTLLQTVCRTITFQQGDLKAKRPKKIQEGQLSTGEFLGHGPPQGRDNLLHSAVPFVIRWLRHRFPGSAVRVRGRCHGAPRPHSRKDPKNPRAADHSAVFDLKLGCKSWVVWSFENRGNFRTFRTGILERGTLNSNMAPGRFPIIGISPNMATTWP